MIDFMDLDFIPQYPRATNFDYTQLKNHTHAEL